MSDKWQQKIIIRGFKVEIAFICKLLADIELRERETENLARVLKGITVQIHIIYARIRALHKVMFEKCKDPLRPLFLPPND